MNRNGRHQKALSVIFSFILVLIGCLMHSPTPVQASDHHNLEEGLPTQLEDTIPVAYRNREIQGLFRWEHTNEGDEIFLFEPRLEYGILPNAQVELRVPVEVGSGVEEEGLGDIAIGALYNFNQESLKLPAFAIAGEIAFPTSEESDGVETTLKFITSKTIGKSSLWQRLHLNLAWMHNDKPEEDERRDYYKGIIGYDVRLTSDMLLILDFVREQQKKRNHESNIVEAGIRYQLTPLTVLSGGIGAGIGDDSPDFTATMAFQHSF
jgi:hypothetical protein